MSRFLIILINMDRYKIDKIIIYSKCGNYNYQPHFEVEKIVIERKRGSVLKIYNHVESVSR